MKRPRRRRVRHRRQQPAPSRSRYWQAKHDGEEGHPVDAAVDRIVGHGAARKRIIRLQDEVLAALGNDEDGKKALLALEELRNQIADEREDAYFNLGYAHGLAEKHATERRRGSRLASEAKKLAVVTRERLVQAKIPPWQAMLCLLECAWSLAAIESRRP